MPDHTNPPDPRRRLVPALAACETPLRAAYDVAMLDLDGVVYRGDGAVDHAAEALSEAAGHGMRLAYVTNNASRTPADVVAKLRALAMPTEDDSVVTSAQAAGRLVADRVPAGSHVLVVGGAGLVQALEERGLVPVRSAEDDPAAVVQGFSPDLGWAQLAEGAYAVAAGVPWIASNTDTSIPTERGMAPGNGTFVAAVAAASGGVPEVAGKPYAPLFDETVLRVGGERPLIVGDRLDTDIEGANNVGADSLLVFTGVCDLDTAVAAGPYARPTFLAPDLRGLELLQRPVTVDGLEAARCGDVAVLCRDGRLVVDDAGVPADGQTAVDLLRAAVGLAWRRRDEVGGESLERLDTSAVRDALRQWGVR